MMDQQQLLAEQLRRYQSQADTQAPQGRMAGRIYARPHALEYLAAGLRGYGGMKGVEDTQGKMRDMEAQKQAAMAQALTSFGQTMQGTPAREEINVDEGPGANTFFRPAAPAQPGDPMAAYQGLVSSGVPDLQKIGMQGVATTAQAQQQRAQLVADQEREAARKAAEQQRILQVLSGAQTPQAALAAGVPAELVKLYFDQGLGKTKLEFVNGQPVNPYSGAAAGAAIPKQPEPFTLSPGGTRYGPDGKVIASVADPNKPFNPDGTPNVGYQKYSIGRAKAGATTVDARSYNTQESEQSRTYGKSVAEMRAEIQKAGLAAPGKLARLSRMEQLLAGVDGGAAAPAMAEIASFASSIGVKIDPKLGNKQAAQALAVEMALAMRQPGSGASTDKDFDNWMATVPDLSKTAEGRKEIIKTMRAGIEREQRAAKFAREYAKANNGVIDDEFFDTLAEWYAQNPVITPNLPATNSRGQAFDPDKEKRYQEWRLKRQGGK